HPSLAQQGPLGDDIAAQVRLQDYPCDGSVSAQKDAKWSWPDEPRWILNCAIASYRVRLIPDMATAHRTVKKHRPGFEQGLSRPFPNRGGGRCKPRTGSPTKHPQQKSRYGALEVAQSAWADGRVQGRSGERKGGARPLEKAKITGNRLGKAGFPGAWGNAGQ